MDDRSNYTFSKLDSVVVLVAFIKNRYWTEKSVKSLLFSLDFYSPQKLFAGCPKTSDNAEGRAYHCATHRPFCQGVCGLPVWPLCPAPPHPPAACKYGFWPLGGAVVLQPRRLR